MGFIASRKVAYVRLIRIGEAIKLVPRKSYRNHPVKNIEKMSTSYYTKHKPTCQARLQKNDIFF